MITHEEQRSTLESTDTGRTSRVRLQTFTSMKAAKAAAKQQSYGVVNCWPLHCLIRAHRQQDHVYIHHFYRSSLPLHEHFDVTKTESGESVFVLNDQLQWRGKRLS